MTKPPNQEQELRRVLASLTPDKAAILAAQLEHQKLQGKAGAEADLVLSVLRKIFGDAALERWPSPERLFCAPFDDFLVDARPVKLAGRIARGSVEPIWTWLKTVGMVPRAEELAQAITSATLARNEPEKNKLVLALQLEASATMRVAIEAAPPGSHARQALINKLGSEDRLADMSDVAQLVERPQALETIRALIPRGAQDLSEQQLASFRTEYDKIVEETPALGPYLVILAMNRLARPWEAMALVRVVSRQSQDRLLSATDLGLAGELLISDIEEQAAAVAAVRPEDFEAAALARSLERLGAASAGMAREMGIKRDGKWGARIQKARTLAANAVQALLGRCAQEVLAPFPLHKSGSFAKGPRKPDLTRAPDAVRVERALRWAGLLAAVKPMGQSLGYQSAHQAAFDEIDLAYRQYSEAVLTDMRAGDPVLKAMATAYLEAQARVSALLIGEDQAALIRRRAAAALAA